MSLRQPYSGSQRKLVLAFDVGTTFSGISYSILDPGEVPEIRGVTRYPAQEHVGGDSKIPTVIQYDKQGRVQAVGAEALQETVEEIAEEEEWPPRTEWFKLHLRPKTKSASHVTQTIPPLPEGKTATEVFADFLRYLYQCARTYIEETHANGVDLWRNLESRTDFVLTHPNGWEGAQQSLMRRAAVLAGLIPDSPAGQRRLSFVTEGEASLHFCISSGLTTEAIKQGKGILIVDAGGGTIDISAYKQASQDIKSFEEMAAPQCHFQGSIFVTNNAKSYLEKFLKGSRFVNDIPYITKVFDKTTKLRFRNAEDAQFIKFGGIRDKDPALNIRSGQLKLLGTDVAAFFEPSVECIANSIEQQRAASKTAIASVFLVGGFAASDWLFNNLKDRFSAYGLDISRPDSHVNKAVADGAISFYLDHFVGARVSKHAYGTNYAAVFQPNNPEHIARMSQKFVASDGRVLISGAFDVILPKACPLSEVQEFRQSYCLMSRNRTDLQSVSSSIRCYRGENTNPRWLDVDRKMYSTLCVVTADTSQVPVPLCYSINSNSMYYRIEIDIILSFGMTELKAQIAWNENGVEKRSPAEIVYEPDELTHN
ncbi:Heat shock 70 kDa protein 12A [Psilocybe cubensis]|uniref:Uncharacterized protein n=2 Tax=Psilocybe cubensis TaxID=181762 RepID=A0A8H8CPU5_PSICU|nr:Heat shock 70 kDa protein 12A [Psilocybe cubensis]KAH9485825.1 Heat shock 70 kDa protein 12A [Psilocybe cubensis]